MHPLHDVLLSALRIDIRQMVEEGHDGHALLAELACVAATEGVRRLGQRDRPVGG